MKRITIQTDIDIDPKFWALLPALNINLGSKQFEFEWLCLGIYIGKLKPIAPKKNTIEYELHISVDSKPALKAIRKIKRKLILLKIKSFFRNLF